MAEPGYRLLDHTADLGLRVWGQDLPAALDQAVRALAEVTAGRGTSRAVERRAVHLKGPLSMEQALVHLLQECIYLLEVDGWLACEASLTSDPISGLAGWLSGEPFDPVRHGEGAPIKGVTWHQLDASASEGRTELTVFLDL